ncbi:MAG: TonB family protein [Betaproteobacteria bacterium]|nr:TonB family protein [Betaproteobacteria bacterium]
MAASSALRLPSGGSDGSWYQEPAFLYALVLSLALHVAFLVFGPDASGPKPPEKKVLEIRLIQTPPKPRVEEKPKPEPERETAHEARRSRAHVAPKLASRTDLAPVEVPRSRHDTHRPRAAPKAPAVPAPVRPGVRTALPESSTLGVPIPESQGAPALSGRTDEPPRSPRMSADATRVERPRAEIQVPRISPTITAIPETAEVLALNAAPVPRRDVAPTPQAHADTQRPTIDTPSGPVASEAIPAAPAAVPRSLVPAPARARPNAPIARAEVPRPEAATTIPVAPTQASAVPDLPADTAEPEAPTAPSPKRPTAKAQPARHAAPRPHVAAAPVATGQRPITLEPAPDVSVTPVPARRAALPPSARPGPSAAAQPRVASAPDLDAAEPVVPETATPGAAGPRPTKVPVRKAPRPGVPADQKPTIAAAEPSVSSPELKGVPVPPVPAASASPERPRAAPKPTLPEETRPEVSARSLPTPAARPLPLETAAVPELDERPRVRPEPKAPGLPKTRVVSRPDVIVEVVPASLPAGVSVPSPTGVPGLGRSHGDKPGVSGPAATAAPVARPSIAPVPGEPTVDRGALKRFGFALTKLLGKDQKYPEKARRLQQQGEVRVKVLLTRHSKIKSAEVVKSSGYPLLDQEAIEKVLRLRSLPALPKGTANGEISVTIPIEFRLE